MSCAEGNPWVRRPHGHGDAGARVVVRILHFAPRTAGHEVPVALRITQYARPLCGSSERSAACPCARDIGEWEWLRYGLLTSLASLTLTVVSRASPSETMEYIEVRRHLVSTCLRLRLCEVSGAGTTQVVQTISSMATLGRPSAAERFVWVYDGSN